MNPSELFIKRPVTTLLLMLALLVFGTLSYQQLRQRPADGRLPHYPGHRFAAPRQKPLSPTCTSFPRILSSATCGCPERPGCG